MGVLISVSSTLLIPAVGIYQVWKRYQKGKQIGLAMFRPTHNWKPAAGAVAVSLANLTEVDPKTSPFQRQTSRRGSRASFRRHLPPNPETLLE